MKAPQIKHAIIALLFVLCPEFVLAQEIMLSGRVVDKKDSSDISFATISVEGADYSEVGISNEGGEFSISLPGRDNYILKINCIGYKDYEDTLRVQASLNLGFIYLEEDPELIAGAVVVGVKNLVRREIDRLVFDASAIAVASLSLYDLLSSTPGVTVIGDDISIIGSGGVKVLIDDRDTKLEGKELIAILKSYSSEDVDKIEVITTPPSKYDAEGSAGIINIRMKRRMSDYFGGSVSDMQLFSKYNGNEYSATLHYNKGRLRAYSGIAGGFGHHGNENNSVKYYPDLTYDDRTEHVNNNLYIVPRLEIDYKLPKDYTIGMVASYLYMKPDYDVYLSSITTENGTSTTSNTHRDSDIITNQYDVNFHIDKQLDSTGKKITLDADILGYDSNWDTDYSSDSWFNYQNVQSYKINIFSTRLDAYLPYDKLTLNVGAKYSYTDNNTRLDYTDNSTLNLSNDNFLYLEHIAAVYGDASLNISPKFQLKAGVRAEYTNIEGISYITNESNHRDYLKFFPTLYLKYSPSETSAHSLSLTRRINRPYYSTLNPMVSYSSDHSYTEGNPYLNPSYNYRASYGYTYNNLSFELMYSFTDDVFDYLMTMDTQTNVTIYKWMNYKKQHRIILNNSYFFNKWNWLQSYLSHSVYWNKSIAEVEEEYSRNGWTYSMNLYNTFYFNRAKTFTGNLSLYFRTKTYTADQVEEPYYYINGGLQHTFFNNKLALGFSVYNILASKYRATQYDGDLYIVSDNIYNYRSFNISLTWRFGGYSRSGGRSRSNSEERNRVG